MQKSEFQKELKKVAILLAVGVILIIASIIAMYSKGYMKGNRLSMHDFPVFISVLLYPLGITYGWRKMLDIALFRRHYESADRYYTVSERNIYHWSHIFVRCMVIGLVVCLGWIIGVYQAAKRLLYLKNQATVQ